MDELAALVFDANRAGTSFEQMSARAERAGYTYSRTSFHNLATGKTERPEREHLPAIAAGLGMTEPQVVEAAARQARVHVEHNIDQRTSELLHAVGDLAPAERVLWFRMARALARELAEAANDRGGLMVIMPEQQVDEHRSRQIERGFDEMTRSRPKGGRRKPPE